MIANGFYSDGTCKDLTGQVDWTLAYKGGPTVAPGDSLASIESKGQPTPGKLRLSQSLQPGTEFVITATYQGGLGDTAQVEVDL
jgi:hypothetical protein